MEQKREKCRALVSPRSASPTVFTTTTTTPHLPTTMPAPRSSLASPFSAFPQPILTECNTALSRLDAAFLCPELALAATLSCRSGSTALRDCTFPGQAQARVSLGKMKKGKKGSKTRSFRGWYNNNNTDVGRYRQLYYGNDDESPAPPISLFSSLLSLSIPGYRPIAAPPE